MTISILTSECTNVTVCNKRKGPFSIGKSTKFLGIIDTFRPFFGQQNPKTFGHSPVNNAINSTKYISPVNNEMNYTK